MVRREMMKLCLCVLPIFLAGSVVMADVAVNVDAVTSDGAWPVNLPFSLGYTFTVDTEIIVTELGRFDIDGAGWPSMRWYDFTTGIPERRSPRWSSPHPVLRRLRGCSTVILSPCNPWY